MAKIKSGSLGGIEWSEKEGRDELYAFARDNDVPGINSRSRKADIVAALAKASAPNRATKVARKPKPAEPKATSPKAAPKHKQAAPKLSPEEQFRRTVAKRRRR
jgi:cell division septation protein DedD